MRGYLDPTWGMVMEEAWLRGMLAVPAGAPSLYDSPAMARAWLACVWTRPPRGQIEPVKERNAEQLALDSLTDTRTAICHARGLDFETVARTRQREERLIKTLGLEPQQAPPPASPVDEPAADGDDASDDEAENPEEDNA